VTAAARQRLSLREYHIAGVNAMLSKDSSEAQLADGVRNVMRSGCYTDPRFAAA
jgi:DNA-binding NarL/FixJ family response regulator